MGWSRSIPIGPKIKYMLTTKKKRKEGRVREPPAIEPTHPTRSPRRPARSDTQPPLLVSPRHLAVVLLHNTV
uniref:Uncharacterized protein n=1 Tax=Setaria viridis TaxID=4556 RepID=A0A4U6TIV6_SETVI|nr:hypothetical protein SEVIR_8G113600v2 [Setaria viridis]